MSPSNALGPSACLGPSPIPSELSGKAPIDFSWRMIDLILLGEQVGFQLSQDSFGNKEGAVSYGRSLLSSPFAQGLPVAGAGKI